MRLPRRRVTRECAVARGSGADGAVGPARGGAHDGGGGGAAAPGGARGDAAAAAAPDGDKEQGDDAHRLVGYINSIVCITETIKLQNILRRSRPKGPCSPHCGLSWPAPAFCWIFSHYTKFTSLLPSKVQEPFAQERRHPNATCVEAAAFSSMSLQTGLRHPCVLIAKSSFLSRL